MLLPGPSLTKSILVSPLNYRLSKTPAPPQSSAPNAVFLPERLETGARIFFWLLLLTLAGVATWANLDLTGQRGVLFMDEMIPFDNVKRILSATSPEALRFAVADGGDHRYGRIFYNVSALVAWLPYRLAGDSGLIIAVRSTQVALLLGGMVILTLGLIRTWGARALALLAMACLPYTDYYLSQPKPEPVQLLWYALFMLFAVRRKFAFGWHWLFLGLAFGAKISAALFCAAAAMLAIIHLWLYAPGWKRTFYSGTTAGIGFIAGWIIAIPMLAVPLRRRSLSFGPNRTHLGDYLNWTFKGTGHGSDDSRITMLDWLKSLLTGGEVVRGAYPAWLAGALMAVIGLVLALALVGLWRRRIVLRDFFETHSGWLVLGLAAALLLPTMLAVKRLWGFYLFPGQVFAIVAVAGITEQLLSANELPSWLKLVRRAAISALVALTLTTCYFCGKSALQEYGRLAHRTSDPVYLRSMAVYERAVEILTALAREIGRENGGTLDVVYDLSLFLPDPRPNLNIRVFPAWDEDAMKWSADVVWKQNPAVLVLDRTWHLSYFLNEKPLPPETAASYQYLASAVEQFKTHVESDPAVTSAKPYQLVRWLSEDAAVIMRRDIADKWRKLSGPGSAASFQK